ncbi:hypothetical protein I302_102071 [Kwoniella bestiolae CBS 10118]|uniref:Uncharacterized protein n=1 Tax=Kwoniella bestiolae CBS 10118 TaxID=1296100 RepID=A0A1B9GE26_9TREE|nr:hypothetical protein I302_00756 [Kwoniella bestiolae CBS 10118]OCF29260.1 hypothetical protein I302_00756 [Kwoniella bestiolae CBS 10118]
MTSPSPSPSLVLHALQAHLLPQPILAYLPTLLNLFAHLQLLSSKIQSEATRALVVHNKLVRRLKRKGYSDREQVLRGALSEKEGNGIASIKKRRGEAESWMLDLSMEFRKHHIATILSTPKIPFGQVQRIIESYFPPDLESDGVKGHPALYIRCMTSEQVTVLNQYSNVVKEWYERAKVLKDENKPPLSYSDFYPYATDNGKSKQDSLCKNILKEAEKVIDDMRELQSIFGEEKENGMEGKGEMETYRIMDNRSDEVGQDPLSDKEKDESRRYTSAEKGKGKEVESGNTDKKKDASLKYPSHHAKAKPQNRSITLTHPSSPPPISPTSHSVSMSDPSSPSPTTTNPPQQTTTHEPIDLTVDSSQPTNLPQQSGMASHSSISQISTSSDRRKTLPSTFVLPPTTSSPKTKKRPRQSYPATGPDYTAPLRVGTVGKEKLRPFEDSELRGGKRARV